MVRKRFLGVPLTFKIILLTIVSTFILIIFDKQIRPIIITIAGYQSRIIAVLAINESLSAELFANPQLYQNLISVERAEDGSIALLTANALLINEAKSTLTNVVAANLQNLRERQVAIPLGTVLGWQPLSGKGPMLRFSVLPASYVESDIITRVETAGINQTKNSVYIRFNVKVSAIIPGYTTTVDVQNDVLIADLLVVGNVPLYYGFVGNDNFAVQNSINSH